MSYTYDIVVVGAGIVGLATARELHQRHPQLAIAVVDKESGPGRHQSGHNSGVLHAGVYYKHRTRHLRPAVATSAGRSSIPGSLKAQLCVQGKSAMERFADEHGIGYETCGKLIVAVEESELARLADLEERGNANGVPGLRVVGPEELREIEPHAAGIRALHSPCTGIINFGRVVEVLAELLRAGGVDFYFGHRVTGLRHVGSDTAVETSRGDIVTRRVVSCGGLHADRLASMDSAPDVAVIPFRGDYYTLTPEARELCRGLIYPVPDPSLPFLGVHFTKQFDGAVWAGPNAVLATAREGYRRSDVDLRDLTETVRYPGFIKLARRWWKAGAQEFWRDVIKAAFVKDLQKYVPSVQSSQLVFGPSGVQAQAVGVDGSLVDDFKLAVTRTSVHVLNAPSPAATASLAIAGRLADSVDDAFALGNRSSSTST